MLATTTPELQARKVHNFADMKDVTITTEKVLYSFEGQVCKN